MKEGLVGVEAFSIQPRRRSLTANLRGELELLFTSRCSIRAKWGEIRDLMGNKCEVTFTHYKHGVFLMSITVCVLRNEETEIAPVDHPFTRIIKLYHLLLPTAYIISKSS